MLDFLIKNARVYGIEGLKDIGIRDGKIAKVDSSIVEESKQIIYANGKLTIPSFIEPHIHLDKVMILETIPPNETGTLFEAIELTWNRKRRYTVEDIVERASRVVRSAVRKGITFIRTHVDVDPIGGLMPLKGVLELRERFKDIVDIQIVAFPQEGIIKSPGTEELLYQAMEMGADVVGGMPANEDRPYDSERHIEILFEIAKKYNADIDMHVDETDDPCSRTLEMLADKTIDEGYQGRVTAGHTCALAAYPDDYAEKVMEKVKKAGIHMITNPCTNLCLQGRLDKHPKRRGLTRVKELWKMGVNVAYGQDCVKDAFYPFGNNDLLQVGVVLCYAAHMTLPDEIKAVFEMDIFNAAKIVGLKRHRIEEGGDADIVILDCEDHLEALRLQPPRLYVIRKGKIVARETCVGEIFRAS